MFLVLIVFLFLRHQPIHNVTHTEFVLSSHFVKANKLFDIDII